MKTIKQRFTCGQCNLIWDVLIYPYYPGQKEIEIGFKMCPHCGSENLIRQKINKTKEG